MKKETKDNRTILVAKKGYFLANKDMSIYGERISLGSKDKPENYKELPLSEMPVDINSIPLTPEEEAQFEALLKRKQANKQ